MRLINQLATLRFVLILWATVVALGRLGLLNVGSTTLVPKLAYGLAFLLAALLLALTYDNGRRLAWGGRLAALYAGVCFFSLAADVLPAVSSSLYLFICWLGCWLEATTWRDC
jgi:chromate transport protein ChrA